MKKILFFMLALIVSTNSLLAQNDSTSNNRWTSGRPDGHAPIGVMGDHTHKKGDVMFSYRYMYMDMEGMRDGTASLSTADVVSPTGRGFMISPTVMPMKMHMLGGMYAVSDKLTLMVMFNYLEMDMDHETRMGGKFSTSSKGFGDMWVSGLYKVMDANRQTAHFNLGVRIPTGSIGQADVTPASAPNETQLPYPMQIGTGTIDIKPGITYLLQGNKTSWGAQASINIPLAENNRGYKWGTKTQISAWGAYKLTDWMSASLRGTGTFQGEIEGADAAYTMAVAGNMVPTVFAGNFGGSWLMAGGGFNFYLPNGALKNFRLGIEYELPVIQDLNGPQMELQQQLTIGLQYSL